MRQIIITTPTFDGWIDQTPDKAAQLFIAARMTRLEAGDVADTLSVGEGILEMPIDHGTGYRIYLVRRQHESGEGFVVLSGSTTHSSRQSDIVRARDLAAQFKD